MNTAALPSPPLRAALHGQAAVASGRLASRHRRRLAQGWARRLVSLVSLVCLAVVASIAPLCEMECAFDPLSGPRQAQAHIHGHHGAGDSSKPATQHGSSDQLHAGACHLSAAAVIPALAYGLGPFDLPVRWLSIGRAVIASLSWPPPERPPRLGTSS